MTVTLEPAEVTIPEDAVLVYVHDPMCSWCYGFRPTWVGLRAILPQCTVCGRLGWGACTGQ